MTSLTFIPDIYIYLFSWKILYLENNLSTLFLILSWIIIFSSIITGTTLKSKAIKPNY